MNKMIDLIICPDDQKEITLIDINEIPIRKSRLYCAICFEKYNLNGVLQIKNVPIQYEEFSSQILQGIHEEYGTQIEKLVRIKKLLNTQKDATILVFDDLIEKVCYQYQILARKWNTEVKYFEMLKENINLSKLQEIAEYLSGGKYRSSKLNDLKLKLNEILNWIQVQISEEIQNFWNLINETDKITKGLMVVKNTIQQQFQTLVYNSKMIAGGIGEDIVIWDVEEEMFKKSAILHQEKDYMLSKLYNGNVNSIVIYQSGDTIIVGRQDNYISVWIKSHEQWNLVQKNIGHKKAITQLKLTPNEEYLISASMDSSFKIWRLSKNRLQCVQTFTEPKQPLFYIAISNNLKFLATSSCQNYVNMFQLKKHNKEELNLKKMSSIQAQGRIHRIHFTDEVELIYQQVNPPKITILIQKNNVFQYAQEILLGESDIEYIQFPIFESGKTIYCKNGKFLYIFKRSYTGHYYIEQTIEGQFCCGCVDTIQNNLILGSQNQEIQIYEYY